MDNTPEWVASASWELLPKEEEKKVIPLVRKENLEKTVTDTSGEKI